MLTSPEVARWAALRAIGAAVEHEASNYRQWIADGAHKSGRVDPLEATDVNSECSHERLPYDPCPSPDGVWPHPHPCACWNESNGFTPEPAPDLMSMFTKETVMSAAPAVPAPLGYLADGVTPRKRRASKTRAASARRRAGKVNQARKARLKLASPPARGTSRAVPISTSLLVKTIADFDAEIARLTEGRDRLKELVG